MRPPVLRLSIGLVLAALFFAPTALAQAPAGYYDTVDAGSAAALRATLHDVIDDHTRVPYTSGGTDTWDVLEDAQTDPSNSGRILDVYKNASYVKQGGGGSNYNREHIWPNSYGFPVDSGSNYPYTDCHALRLCDISYNGIRDNAPFRDCDAGCSEHPTDLNGGLGGGTGAYPGNSNWSDGSGSTATFEVWSGRRGDVARAMLYLDVRYEGGTHGGTGANEPDLILTDDQGLITSSLSGSNQSVAYMGLLSVLLQWHLADPVDQFEMDRNDAVFGYQGNRNPFVDHPEWVGVLYLGQTLSPTLSVSPTTIDLTNGGAANFVLDAGSAFAGKLYFLLGSGSGTSPGVAAGIQLPLNYDNYLQLTLQSPNALIQNSLGFLDGNGHATAKLPFPAGAYVNFAGTHLDHAYIVFDIPGTTLALDVSNPIGIDLELGGGAGSLVINEVDYDQPGNDTNEFIEIYNAGGTSVDLSNVVLELHNGSGGAVYDSFALSAAGASLAPGAYLVVGSSTLLATVPMGVQTVTFAGRDNQVQNGAPDGIVLKDGATVLDSVSYEGTMAGITEGTGGAPTDGNSVPGSVGRAPGGVDTDDNAADFALSSTPTPGSVNVP
jgi:endonuclease I